MPIDLSHGAFVEFMKNFHEEGESGYYVNERGMCYGIANMAMQAMLFGELEKFRERLRKISNEIKKIEDLKAKTFQAKVLKDFQALKATAADKKDASLKGSCPEGASTSAEPSGSHSVYNGGVEQAEALGASEALTDDLINYKAFFDGVSLYHNPDNHKHLFFEQNILSTINLTQSSGRPLVFSLIKPVEFDKNICKIHNFTFVYSKNTLKDYLKILAQTAQTNVAFLLAYNKHAIFLGYDLSKNTWSIVDANNLSYSDKDYNNDESGLDTLVEIIFDFDFSNEHYPPEISGMKGDDAKRNYPVRVISTEIFTIDMQNSNEEYLTCLIDTLKSCQLMRNLETLYASLDANYHSSDESVRENKYNIAVDLLDYIIKHNGSAEEVTRVISWLKQQYGDNIETLDISNNVDNLAPAIVAGNKDLIEAILNERLLNNDILGEALVSAATTNKMEIVQLILKTVKEENIDECYFSGALLGAVNTVSTSMVEFLVPICKGKDCIGEALVSAATTNKMEIVQLILKTVKEENIAERYFRDALLGAVGTVSTSMVEFLAPICKRKGCIDDYDSVGYTPLIRVIIRVNVNMVNTLLFNGADVNKSSEDGVLSPWSVAYNERQAYHEKYNVNISLLLMQKYYPKTTKLLTFCYNSVTSIASTIPTSLDFILRRVRLRP